MNGPTNFLKKSRLCLLFFSIQIQSQIYNDQLNLELPSHFFGLDYFTASWQASVFEEDFYLPHLAQEKIEFSKLTNSLRLNYSGAEKMLSLYKEEFPSSSLSDNIDLEIRTNKKSCCCGFFTCCTSCSSFRIPTKRFFLPLLSLLYFVSLENTQHYVFFPLIITATSFIIFYNFPFLVYYSNTKPLYYEDLFIDTSSLPIVNLDSKIRKNFENTFDVFSKIQRNT